MNEWQDAETRIERALQLTETEQWSEALEELEAAIAINPHDPVWHAQHGHILDHLDRFEEAVKAYYESLELRPDALDVQTALGIDLIRTGRYADAVHRFEKIAEEHPEFEPAYCHRIAAYTRMGQHDDAETMFYLAQQIEPQCPHCFHHIAESLACRGKFDRAIYCWQRTLEIEPRFPSVRQRIAEIWRARQDYDKARQHYLDALRQEPGNTEILADLGDLLIELEDLAGAEAKFRQVLDLDPAFARANVMMGMIASQRGDSSDAVRYFESALALDESYPGLRTYLGEAQLRQGKHHEASYNLSLALEDNPDDCIALMAMGNCLLELYKPVEAENYFRQLIERQGNVGGPGAYHNLAVCRFLQGDYREGIQFCQSALELDPQNELVLYKLALAYTHQADWTQARQMLDRGLAIAPSHAGMVDLSRRLPRLRIKHLFKRIKSSRNQAAGVAG
jgi:Flp pilus assembly protein TadD